ncbi:Uncharacterised protein [uncultured archaeon]|nr:Uncharacterised protein [uncultured archaeon]
MARSVLIQKVLGEPGSTIFPVSRPDITLSTQRLSHHHKRRECHPLIFVDKFAPELHPRGFDGKCGGAPAVTHLASGAYKECVYHLLVPVDTTFHIFAQPVPLSARALAFPAAPVELVAFIQAIPALRAGIGIPRNISRDVAYLFVGTLAYARGNIIAKRTYQRLNRSCYMQSGTKKLVPDHFARVHYPFGIDPGFISAQLIGLFFAKYSVRFP